MHTRHKGSTLVLAMLMMLVLLGLAASMTYNAQSQANLAGGVKLQQYYETAALNAFNQARVLMPDYWVDVESIDEPINDRRWRFGDLLQQAADKGNVSNGNFPDSAGLSYTMDMNEGMLELTYKIWIANNPDDPAVLLQNYDLDTSEGENIITKNWDMDGKIVLTVEVFAPNDSTYPVSTQSAILGPVGGEFAYIHDDAVLEGDASDVGGQGTGTAGSGGSISISPLETP